MRPHKTQKKKIFPSEEIKKMGGRVEAILFSKNIESYDLIILEYVKACLLFRKSENKEEMDFYHKKSKELEKKLPLSEEKIYALALWARGSRQNENQILTEEEFDRLYERVTDKLDS